MSLDNRQDCDTGKLDSLLVKIPGQRQQAPNHSSVAGEMPAAHKCKKISIYLLAKTLLVIACCELKIYLENVSGAQVWKNEDGKQD